MYGMISERVEGHHRVDLISAAGTTESTLHHLTG